MEMLFLFIFLTGLCVGSFVNMLVYRYAVANGLEKAAFAKATTSQSRSYCDFCGKQLRWYENIPVISWLWLGGKSRCCKKQLPILYPIVELGTAVLLTMSYAVIGSWLATLLVAVMIFSCVVDLKYMILPDMATLVLVIGAVVLAGAGNWGSALGAVSFLGLIYLLSMGKAMGFGDVKLAVFMGLLLGFPRIVVAFYVAFIIGAIVGGGLMLFKKVGHHSPIPFGPFLFLGTMVAWWYGDNIWYIVFGR